MDEKVVNAELKSPEPRIEPYYQSQGKFLTDTLFDLGCLSESLSRDGIKRVEDLVALMFQQIADAANRCSSFTKKYKKDGHGEGERVRHEEEMRWISRTQEAENSVIVLADKLKKLTPWHKDVVKFLRETLGQPEGRRTGYGEYLGFASHLLNKAFELGMAGPDCRPGPKIILGDEIRQSGDGCACPPETPYPGMVIPEFCRVCGGRKI